MKPWTSLVHRLACLLILGGLVMTGCSPKTVDVLSVDGPDRLETDEPGTFQATIDPKSKPPVMYQWNFGDNQMGEGNPASHAFTRAGTYTVTLTATNRKGKGMDTGQTTVVVVDAPVPAQILTILADPTDADTRTPIRFGANVRGDAPMNYNWSFGDGGTAAGAAPIYTYEQPGNYTVTLEVSNDAGRDSRTLSVTVLPFESEYCAELAEMSTVFFERNSSILTEEAERILGDNLDIMQDCPNLNVRVEGQADPFERNPQRLSEDRARAVEQFYIDMGVSGARIQTAGLGRATGTSKKSGTDQFRRADTIPLN